MSRVKAAPLLATYYSYHYLPLHIEAANVYSLLYLLPTTHYSLPATHYYCLLLTTHYSLLSLLTTHYPPLTTHYSLLTTHYSLLTTHYSLLTPHYLLLTPHSLLLLTPHSSLPTPHLSNRCLVSVAPLPENSHSAPATCHPRRSRRPPMAAGVRRRAELA